MIRIIADNILSPLGATTAENLAAVREGRSALAEHRHEGMPEAFVASLFDTPLSFEEGLKLGIRAALADAEAKGRPVNPSAADTLFVVSSTKGNIADFEPLADSARRVAQHFGNANRPVVVSNACISGLSALITAKRLLESGEYRTAIVVGYDVQSKFIVSGFQSFKALAPDPCRPFDGDRCGLNLGEAVATMVLTVSANEGGWIMRSGAVNNDANHISNPSRTAEGSLRAIEGALTLKDADGSQSVIAADDLACISAHGTATLYNDEMEAVAIDRAGLSHVPVFSLKGYYGHTMGAAGLLESIITLHAVEEGWIPATRGFEEEGTSRPINVSGNVREVALGDDGKPKRKVLKLLSGFGGCNAAVVFELQDNLSRPTVIDRTEAAGLSADVRVTISSPASLTELYKELKAKDEANGNYPKFYKMDPLSKLGYIASEMLLEKEAAMTGCERFTAREDRAVVICTRHGSLADDLAYQDTISRADEYFPSPAVFVYTLPNIVTGEIALRNHYYGETSCFDNLDNDNMTIERLVRTAFADRRITSVIGGWLDYVDADHFSADLAVYHSKE
ncbi:MAG: 3-oxoacyl-ACP synthase [Bacteroidales bacterium]|nr:3-oxoacyl-ACP synthase [Candidatus Liminaster caballi]